MALKSPLPPLTLESPLPDYVLPDGRMTWSDNPESRPQRTFDLSADGRVLQAGRCIHAPGQQQDDAAHLLAAILEVRAAGLAAGFLDLVPHDVEGERIDAVLQPFLLRTEVATPWRHVDQAFKVLSRRDVAIWKVEMSMQGDGPAAVAAHAWLGAGARRWRPGDASRGGAVSVPGSSRGLGSTAILVLASGEVVHRDRVLFDLSQSTDTAALKAAFVEARRAGIADGTFALAARADGQSDRAVSTTITLHIAPEVPYAVVGLVADRCAAPEVGFVNLNFGMLASN